MITGMRAHIAGTAGVIAAIGARLFPDVAPSNAAVPYAVYTVTDENRNRHLRDESGFRRTTVEFRCHGATRSSAMSAAQAIIDSIGSGFTGTWATKTVPLANWSDEPWSYNPPLLGDDGGRHEVGITLIVRWFN